MEKKGKKEAKMEKKPTTKKASFSKCSPEYLFLSMKKDTFSARMESKEKDSPVAPDSSDRHVFQYLFRVSFFLILEYLEYLFVQFVWELSYREAL